MTFLPRVAALVVAASSVWVAPAVAADCGSLKMLSSMDLEPLGSSGLMLVPVTINGVPKKMLLNTAGGISSLNSATIDTMGLRPLDTGGNFRLLSSDGSVSTHYVNLQDMQLGSMVAKNVDLMVAPGSNNPNVPFDGFIGGDFIANYDVELDFTAHKLNYFSTDHCDGQVVYWPASAVAMVPFNTTARVRRNSAINAQPISTDTRIRVPVTLDGKNFNAVISTGSNLTTMSPEVAKYVFGVTLDSPGAVPLVVVGDQDKKSFTYVFDTLTFGGITVRHLRVAVIPDLTGAKDRDNKVVTESRIGHVDDGLADQLMVGLDVLKNLHLYIAYGERRLYLTPGSQPDMTAAGQPGEDATSLEASPLAQSARHPNGETVIVTATRAPPTLQYTPVVGLALSQMPINGRGQPNAMLFSLAPTPCHIAGKCE